MRIHLVALFVFVTACSFGQGVSINNTGAAPDGSAMLDITSTDKGVLLPRVTTAQRTAISTTTSSDLGLLVYDSDTDSFWYWNGTIWVEITTNLTGDDLGNHIATQNIQLNGNWLSDDGDNEGIRVASNGFVGIGNSNPDHALVVGPSNTGGRHLVINDIPTARWGLATGNYDLSFQSDYGGGWNTRVIFTETGNVGIGTITPDARLNIETPDNGSDWPATNSRGDVDLYLERTNQGIEIGQGGGVNERKAWLLARHNDVAGFGEYYQSFHLQPALANMSQYRGIGIGYGANTAIPVNTFLAVAGNTGIGITSPDSRLHVEGQVKITGGNPADGRVLTSDANGLATWENKVDVSNVFTSVAGIIPADNQYHVIPGLSATPVLTRSRAVIISYNSSTISNGLAILAVRVNGTVVPGSQTPSPGSGATFHHNTATIHYVLPAGNNVIEIVAVCNQPLNYDPANVPFGAYMWITYL